MLNDIFSIFDAEALIRDGGLLLACLIVFGTTGLFFCFFLPSGAVLFTAGVFTATGDIRYDLFTVSLLLFLSSFFGSLTGYWFGRRTGPLLYKRNDTRFFRKKHLKTAEAFYAKYGGQALTLGLFLPIVRTFASVIAGIIRLDFRRFIILTLIGSAIWVISFVAIGYFIGSQPMLRPWLKYIVLAFLLLVTLPLVIRVIRELKGLSKTEKDKKVK